MSEEKTTNWTEAIERAKKHPSGQFSNTHRSTLRAIEDAGIAELAVDGEFYLTDKGWGEQKPEEPQIEEAAPAEVTYKVQDTAMWQLHLDVTGAPDTSHPDHPGAALRPVGVSLGIGHTDGVWSVSAVNVFGQKVKDGKVVTKRNYPLPFLDPLGEDSDAPEWLRKICQDWVDKANGKTAEPYNPASEVFMRQVDPEEKARSRAALEVSPQRASFDTALNVLLMRENLDGTEWAIKQIREMAEGPELGAAGLHHLADGLEKLLDKRAAELATREN